VSQTPRNELDNPFFARFYRRNRQTADRRGERDHRRRLLEGLHGRVVEHTVEPGTAHRSDVFCVWMPSSVEGLHRVLPRGPLLVDVDQQVNVAD
jgi:hypothetical protein